MPYHRVLHHQAVPADRRDIRPPSLDQLLKPLLPGGAVEIHLTERGRIEWLLGGETTHDLDRFVAAYERVYPGCGVSPDLVKCALSGDPASSWTFAWARRHGHHWNPLDFVPKHDYADALVNSLSSKLAVGHEVVVQVLFRLKGGWEENLHLLTPPRERLLLGLKGYSVSLSGSYSKSTPMQWEQDQYTSVMARMREPAFHVEIRVGVRGPESRVVIQHCINDSWLKQLLGGKWRYLEIVPERKKVAFDQSMRMHDLAIFVNRKESRDVAGGELPYLLESTWQRQHHLLHYYSEPDTLDMPRESVPSTLPSARLNPVPPQRWQASPDPPVPLGDLSIPLTPSPGRAPTTPKFLPTRLPEAAKLWIELGRTFQNDPIFLSEHPTPWNNAVVLGEPGMGKSTLFLRWITEILGKKGGSTLVVLDPHGSLVRAIIALLPPDLARETILLDPARLVYDEDGERKVALPLNLLALPNVGAMDAADFSRAREVIVDNLVYFVRNIWGSDVFGPQIDHNVSSLATGMLEIPGTNLVDMYHAMTDPQTRETFANLVRSEGVRKFVLNELPRLTHVRYSQDRVSSTLNRLGKITNNPLLRYALCQRKDPIDFGALLENHRLVLIDLSKTKIGNEASRFLGAMCFARIWLAIQQRGEGGRETYLFMDEFQNFVTPSISHVLAEARKLHLHLIMANQYLEQIPEDIRSALFGNVDIWCFFRMGVEDKRRAAEIARAGRRGWTDETLVSLPPYRAMFVYRNQLEMLNTYPPPRPLTDVGEVMRLVEASTRRYSTYETSEESPLSVDEGRVESVLTPLAQEGALSLEDIAREAAAAPARAWAALKRAEQGGLVSQDPTTERYSLTILGNQHAATLDAKHQNRKEGKDHALLITRVVRHLSSLGVKIAAVKQGDSDDSLSDATAEIDGEPINVEVECTTLEEGTQVVKNLLKALDAGKRCLFVVGSRADANRLLELAAGSGSEFVMGREFVILYGEGDRFLQFPGEEEGVPRFLPYPSSAVSSPSPTSEPARETEPPSAGTQEDKTPSSVGSGIDSVSEELAVLDGAIKALTRKLLDRGDIRGSVTYEEIVGEIPERVRDRFSPTRIGMLLKIMGIRSHRVWEKTATGRRRITVAVLVELDESEGTFTGERARDDAEVEP